MYKTVVANSLKRTMQSQFQIILLCLVILFGNNVYSQTDTVFEKILSKGKPIFNSALVGNFEFFTKDQNNQPNFDRNNLNSYVFDLKNKAKNIRTLKTIEPTSKASHYFYTMVVFNSSEMPVDYYYVTRLMFSVENENVRLVNSWIYTDESSFFKWWRNCLGFCESEVFKTIPDRYKYEVCPPPPKFEK